jgi:hypothetical protein
MTFDATKLVGRTITAVRPLTSKEAAECGWELVRYEIPYGLVLDNGDILAPSRDPEGNGPGALFALTETAVECVALSYVARR